MRFSKPKLKGENIIKYKLSLVIVCLSLVFKSYGEETDNYQKCLKAHDEVLACYNNINISQPIETFNPAFNLCVKEMNTKISQKIETSKYTFEDSFVIEVMRNKRIKNTQECTSKTLETRELSYEEFKCLVTQMVDFLFETKEIVCKYFNLLLFYFKT